MLSPFPCELRPLLLLLTSLMPSVVDMQADYAGKDPLLDTNISLLDRMFDRRLDCIL